MTATLVPPPRNFIIEVGANNGNDTHRYTTDFPEATIWAFEPTPQLYAKLADRFHLNPRVHIYPYAIAEFDGKATFHVAGSHDWGCSSLHEFSDNLHEAWPNRHDFHVTEVIEVECIRLDTLLMPSQSASLRRLPPEPYVIDYLHIDAQGSDFAVLRSLGHYIHSVQAGQVEAGARVALYKHTDNTITDICIWLEHHGFRITEVLPDRQGGMEANIYFERAHATTTCRITGKVVRIE